MKVFQLENYLSSVIIPNTMADFLYLKKYRLEEKTWTRKGFHGIVHYLFPVGEQALKPLKDYYGDSYKITVFFFKGTYGEWYWNDEDMVRLRKSFIKKVDENPAILKKLIRDWHLRLVKFDKIMEEIDAIDLSQLSNHKLLSLYKKWYEAYLQEYGISIGIQDAFSMHAEHFLEPHFRKIIDARGFGSTFSEYYLTLTSPISDSFLAQEYHDRLKILKKAKTVGENKINDRLIDHAKKYHWIHNNYAKDICLDWKYFAEKLKEVHKIDPDKELRSIKRKRQELIEHKKGLIRLLMLDKESKNLIKITEAFAYIQDKRKKYVLIASHYQNTFLKELQNRLSLTREQLEFTFIHELNDLLRGKINSKVFDERRKACLVIQTQHSYEIFAGKDAEEIHSHFFSQKQLHLAEIKGNIASPGKAIGRVKIVLKTHDLVNIKKGDILVTTMTRPEMAIAMQKAAAIVTDEGGITSHAAVVSREMNLPCLIGTKIATKVLKDGDLIEVDAEKGVVRILKK